MTLADLRLPCKEHGLYDSHPDFDGDLRKVCQGRSATIEDLIALLRESHWLVYPPGPPPRPKDLASDREAFPSGVTAEEK